MGQFEIADLAVWTFEEIEDLLDNNPADNRGRDDDNSSCCIKSEVETAS